MTLVGFLRIFLATLFVASAVTKLTERTGFSETLRELGVPMPQPMALAVVGGELLAAALLLWDPTRVWGAAAVLLLSSGFAWANWRAMSLQKALACNCFGSLLPDTFGWRSAVRLMVIVAAALYLLLRQSTASLAGVPTVEWGLAVLTTLGMLLIYATANALGSIRQFWASQGR